MSATHRAPMPLMTHRFDHGFISHDLIIHDRLLALSRDYGDSKLRNEW